MHLAEAECRDSSLVLAANRGYERLRMTNLKGMAKENDCVLRTPAGFSQALIKIYSLVDCPIYSVVKHRPR
jgi:hypothetical protein